MTFFFRFIGITVRVVDDTFLIYHSEIFFINCKPAIFIKIPLRYCIDSAFLNIDVSTWNSDKNY